MRWKHLVIAVTGALLLSLAPAASAQQRRRIIIVEPVPVGPVFYPDPFFYPYAPVYVPADVGYVKIKTHRKHASVYVDGGYAGNTREAKKFALRPGNYKFEVRNSDGETIYRQEVAVIRGKTTKIHVG